MLLPVIIIAVLTAYFYKARLSLRHKAPLMINKARLNAVYYFFFAQLLGHCAIRWTRTLGFDMAVTMFITATFPCRTRKTEIIAVL